MDITDYDDDALDALRVRVLMEQERRRNLEAIPQQVSGLYQTYCEGGGDPDALLRAFTDPSDH